MIIERKLSKWESRNFTRVRKLSPKETQKFYSQLYEQREYAWGLQSIGRAFKGFGNKATSLGNKIDSAGGTTGVLGNIGSNIKTGFENAGTKVKNWWNSGKGAYETSSMYNARMRSGVGPQQAQTKEYKSIFTPKQQPEKFTLDVSAEKKNAFNSHTDGIIKSADGATPTVTSQPKPEPQNINPSGGATDQSVMKQNTGVNSTTPTVTPQPNPEQKNIVNSASGSTTTQQLPITNTPSTNTGGGGSIFNNSGLQQAAQTGGTLGGYNLTTGKPLGSVTPSPTPNPSVTPNPINAQQPKPGTWEYVRAMQKNNSNNRRDIYVDKLGLQRRLFTDYIRKRHNKFNYEIPKIY